MLALEAARAGVWDWDLLGDTLYISDQYAHLMGFALEDFDGAPDGLYRTIHPEDRVEFLGRLNQARYQHRDFAHEFRILLPDASVRWLAAHGRFFYSATGAPERMCGVLTDCTEKRQAQARVERLTHLYHALSEVNQAIVRMHEEGELFPLVCRTAVNFGGMKMAWIGQLNPLNGRIEPAFCFGSALDYLGGIVISPLADVPEGQGPTGTAFRENRAVVINDAGLSPLMAPWSASIARHGFRSTGAFPIRRAGRPFAVLNVYSELPHAFDTETIALLDEMAMDIGFALDNFDRKRQSRQFEDTLRESERRFRTLFEQASVGVAMIDAKTGRYFQVNGYYTRLLGYSEEELRRLSFSEITHPDDLPLGQERLATLLAGGLAEYTIEKRYVRKDGQVVWAAVTVSPMWRGNEMPNFCIAVVMDITERKQSEELIWRQANFDTLTDLPNRRMFRDRLEQEAKKSDREQLPLALLLIDLDQFKEVNDTLGHEVGDVLLREAAQRISACVRESDTVARLGGDEFTVVLSSVDDHGHVEAVAQKILDRLSIPFHLEGEVVFISASIGITLYPNDARDIDSLMKNADQAMYAAKSKGRRRFNYFTTALQDAAQKRLRLTNDLRGALGAHQLRVHFQPIVALATGRIRKAEALLRWQHPQRGMVGPLEFIPLAEETGLINEIGDWVFRESVRWCKRWCTLLGEDFQVGINKSPVQFRGAGQDYSQDWIACLREADLSGRNIVIEITEGLLLHADEDIDRRLLAFRDAGIQVAIDDFGTGYSSLSYLRKFDIDILKIDRAFVNGIETDPDDAVLCEAMIVMAHKLGLEVTAEGVETEGQRRWLAAAGCDFAQGDLFSPPLAPEALEKLLLG